MSACDELVGSAATTWSGPRESRRQAGHDDVGRHQVQVTNPLPTVLATAVPNRNAAHEVEKAAHSTACPGESTRVATTVAIEFGGVVESVISQKTQRDDDDQNGQAQDAHLLAVLDHDICMSVGGVLATVDGLFKKSYTSLSLNEQYRVFFSLLNRSQSPAAISRLRFPDD